MAEKSNRIRARETILEIQKKITDALEGIEGKPFLHDSWIRPDNHGTGQANVVQDGQVFEKGGVNNTEIELPLSPNLAKYMSDRGKLIDMTRLTEYKLYATGVSLVLHA